MRVCYFINANSERHPRIQTRGGEKGSRLFISAECAVDVALSTKKTVTAPPNNTHQFNLKQRHRQSLCHCCLDISDRAWCCCVRNMTTHARTHKHSHVPVVKFSMPVGVTSTSSSNRTPPMPRNLHRSALDTQHTPTDALVDARRIDKRRLHAVSERGIDQEVNEVATRLDGDDHARLQQPRASQRFETGQSGSRCAVLRMCTRCVNTYTSTHHQLTW
jgi:hypothetical protein